MGAGLDELIESLLTEIAFSGVRGCSVSNLLVAIDSFYKPSDRSDELQLAASTHDLAVASKVWKWLADRSDVFIGADRAFNHLSLEEVLALPEEEDPLPPGAAAESSNKSSATTNTHIPPPPRPSARTLGDEARAVRPRLHVSEERQWRTIAGHGPDLKRVPLFEWRALVDIASVKEKGILQGDLVRLTGQDKRSLPTRTDALARKGYIIKQPIVLRGGKSSKLWLAQFAEDAKEHQEREGLDYDKLDLSKSALTSDLHPVPFCDKWNGDNIDYLALAQAFVAIVKAWSLIRYCDARAKLGVEERVRQMRALAKTCRWLTNIGALSFVGAKFAGSNRLFKDCVKYIRDPSPAEWSHFRATPKTRMVVPSGRIGKRGEASRAVHASQLGSRAVHVVPRNASQGKSAGKKSQRTKPQSTKSRNDPTSYTTIIPSPWKPQKPVPNTAFEIIKRAGSGGTSNAAICRQTLGHNYRRLTAAMTGSISMPTNSQPPHLKHLSSASQLSRIGKTMTYTFYANSEIAEIGPSDQHAQSLSADTGAVPASAASSVTENKYGNAFSQLDVARFSDYPGSPLTDIVQSQRSNRVLSKTSKRKRPTDEELDDQPPVKLPRRLGRPPAKRSTNKLPRPTKEYTPSETDDTPIVAQKVAIDQQPPPRPPGVYRGLPNSLDPVTKRKGRRRRSLVLIFRSDKLKDPSFLTNHSAVPEVHDTNSSSPEAATEAATETVTEAEIEVNPKRQSIHAQDVNVADTSATIATPGVLSEGLNAQSGTPKVGKHGSFRCDKCENSWKNSNGLEYHLTKSRTPCNPAFVPPPAGLITDRKRKSVQPPVLESSSVPHTAPQEQVQSRQTLTPKQQIESRFERKKPSSTPLSQEASVASSSGGGTTHTSNLGDTSQPQALRGSIILKDLEVYDANDHQRFLNQRKSGTSKRTSTSNKFAIALDPRLFNAAAPADIQIHNDINNQDEQEITLNYSPNIGAEKARYLTKGQAYPTSNNASIPKGGGPISTPKDRPRIRKPLPTIPSNKPGNSSTSQPTPAHHPSTETPGVYEAYPESPLINHTLAQQSTHKPLAFFAKPTRPNASFGARRRDRTTQIIEYLIEQNDGVFPGLRSLFMAVISVWAKEFRDLAPPDRRICQNTVNQLERDGVIKQMHFYFFDDQGKMQECVVLAKADPKSKSTVDSSDDPRVIAVKEKMREMFPETYVPDAFSLSPDEAKLFDELASQGKEHSQSRNLKIPKDLKRVQDIETLRYENSVMGDISIHRSNNAKRQTDEVQDENQTPSKRARIDIENLDSLERSRKPRRRPDKHEMWDSGKLAVYIWSQRQKPGVTWDQDRSSLQDPATGAWSWTPDTDPSSLDSISTILSSVKSARHIDASLKRKGRRRLARVDRNARGNTRHNYRDHNHEVPITAEDVLMTNRNSGLDFSTLRSLVPLPFGTDSLSDDGTEALYEDSNEIFDDEGASFRSTGVLGEDDDALWFNLRAPFLESRDTANPIMVGRMLGTQRSSRKQPPHDVHNILNTSFRGWADPAYGKFLHNLKTIERLEQSADGFRFLTSDGIAPYDVFISLTVDEAKANLKGTTIEWLGSNQFTADNIPDEVKNASPEDDEYGLSYLMKNTKKSEPKMTGHRAANEGTKSKLDSQFPVLPTPPDGFIEYKTRDLTIIPKQPRGRFNKPAAHDDKLGSKGEDELVAACVAFRTLLGGLDRNLDIGLLLRYFPGMSLSALKKFWPRISRERKSYVQALTAKFQSEFLEAYESGKLPPLDYDDIENYDWSRLILWATQLETHEDVDLPKLRDKLHQKYSVEDVANEDVDWRETWFATTSTYNRIEAVASETMSIPLPIKHRQDRAILERARTWVRSICCTSLKGVNVNDYLVPKLLELGNGDAAETNRILEKAVSELNKEKVITRTKGKDLGGNFRIHGMFSKQLEKLAATPKFRQAIAFKAQLDEVFRHSEEYIMPYASDDGSIMAALNLQAHGRIRIDTIDMPNIPFGFEPGNYEGRTFPKSYYHFKVRLVPTDTYLFNEDMALLDQAQHAEPPIEGPGGKIPIWVDFFGKVNAARWADYVSMIVFTLATKGPIVPKMCVTLLKPMVDEFEVQLIVDWLDKLGLIQQAVHDCGVTGAEWWWLVAGYIVQVSDKSTGKQKASEMDT